MWNRRPRLFFGGTGVQPLFEQARAPAPHSDSCNHLFSEVSICHHRDPLSEITPFARPTLLAQASRLCRRTPGKRPVGREKLVGRASVPASSTGGSRTRLLITVNPHNQWKPEAVVIALDNSAGLLPAIQHPTPAQHQGRMAGFENDHVPGPFGPQGNFRIFFSPPQQGPGRLQVDCYLRQPVEHIELCSALEDSLAWSW